MRFQQTNYGIFGMACLMFALQWASVLSCSEDTSNDFNVDGGGDADTDVDTDSDSDVDSDTDTDADTDVDTDSDSDGDVDTETINTGTGEICGNRQDDDKDGAIDCADLECKDDSTCVAVQEDCNDGKDNDFDGQVDCSDDDCASQLFCQEDCTNGKDDDGDTLVDCADPTCKGMSSACGEVCGDGIDNDLDGKFDCDDDDCDPNAPPCSEPTSDGTICDYKGSEPHTCSCADGIDNDGDGHIDSDDLNCFGPFDDDEESYATGIPGDNEGSKADKECPFDGNSGTGNDDLCCNPADPTQNVTPNGCDESACCEIDVNGNSTGEHVLVLENCVYAPSCGTEGKHNCPCQTEDDCNPGQFCLRDADDGAGFCSTCEPCTVNEECVNTCECGEKCFGGFERPASECGQGTTDDPDGSTGTDTDTDTDTSNDTSNDTGDTGGGTCPADLQACPGGDGDCDAAAGEHCINGCCYPQCEEGVVPCEVSPDCPPEKNYLCITGCCIESPIVV